MLGVIALLRLEACQSGRHVRPEAGLVSRCTFYLTWKESSGETQALEDGVEVALGLFPYISPARVIQVISKLTPTKTRMPKKGLCLQRP